MARKTRATGSGLTPKQWDKKLLKYALEENVLSRMGLIGSDDKACIQIKTDKNKGIKGETVQFQMDAPLTGVGGGDDFNSADIMEAYDNFYQDVTIHERGHTTGINGPMTKQRLLENWDERANSKIMQWKGITMEKEIIQSLSGLYNLSGDVASVNEVVPSDGRMIYGGENASGTLGVKTAVGKSAGTTVALGSSGGLYTDALLTAETATNYLFGPRTLEVALSYWLDQEPRPAPLRIDGEDVYLALITPGQALNLIQNTYYRTHFREADRRGSQNQLMKNSLGVWNCGEHSVLIKAYGRVQKRTGAGGTTPSEGFTLNAGRTATSDAVASGDTVGRALLLGAQACLVGYGNINGQLFKRIVGDLDNGTSRKPFYGIDWLYGVRKSQFSNEAGTSQEDYACCCIDTHQV